jgi:hypothetical protein
MAAEENICFVIAPIGEPDSDIRRRSDVICKYIIEQAAAHCGYKAIRTDQISEPGLITTQVIQHLVNDPMVVADLTARNPNVYYGLAVRHALRKPFIQLIQKGNRSRLILRGCAPFPVDHQDVAVAEEAKAEIIRQMKSMEGEDATIDSPISVAVDIGILKGSGNPLDRQLADVLGLLRTFGEGCPKGLVIWGVMPLSHFWGYHSDRFFNSMH